MTSPLLDAPPPVATPRLGRLRLSVAARTAAARRWAGSVPARVARQIAGSSRWGRWRALSSALGSRVTAREMRARRVVEGLLAVALGVSVVALARARGDDGGEATANGPLPPIASIPIDLARDPPWALRLLPGIGRTKADAIVLDRARAGPLPSVEALARVPGFAAKSVSSLAAAGAVVSAEGAPDPRARPP
jgi:hypothetical protein